MEEIWQDIQGFENKYQVSNTGKVRSLNYMGKGLVRELKQGHGDTRYAQVCLVKNGIRHGVESIVFLFTCKRSGGDFCLLCFAQNFISSFHYFTPINLVPTCLPSAIS